MKDLKKSNIAEKVNIETNSANPVAVQSNLAFGKSNYTIMLAGIALILVGFVIMTMDKEPFGFGFMGLTLGPLVSFAGFMVELYAILKKKS